MPRTQTPGILIHKLEDVSKNAQLFDELVDLMPEEVARETRQEVASLMLERIIVRVVRDGVFNLPFGLSVIRKKK